MSDFPPAGMSEGQDSAYFSEQHMDNTVRAETEGGYTITRPRTTRPPKRIWTTGFTEIDQNDKKLLEDFYRAMRGGAMSFTWQHPVTGQVHVVRFGAEGLNFRYVGAGGNHRWTVSGIKLEEV